MEILETYDIRVLAKQYRLQILLLIVFSFELGLIANNALNMASVFDSVGRRIETFVLFSGDLNL